MTSLLSVHRVKFEKGVYNSSDILLAKLRPNTAAMSSNLGTDIACVGATFTFAAINHTVTSPSSSSAAYTNKDASTIVWINVSATVFEIAPWNSDSGKFW